MEAISANFDLSTGLLLLFFLTIFTVCVFEFVNGFHDTANAVATVIYTHSLKPVPAVIWSGIWNFIGVMASGYFFGMGVAMKIVNLLPIHFVRAALVRFAHFLVARFRHDGGLETHRGHHRGENRQAPHDLRRGRNGRVNRIQHHRFGVAIWLAGQHHARAFVGGGGGDGRLERHQKFAGRHHQKHRPGVAAHPAGDDCAFGVAVFRVEERDIDCWFRLLLSIGKK